ncbi:hypothetical protein S1OALGB6SA_913 [Olavius algarvensis spirochete endosymbiont]|nr:hypothetical protein S1OALGB6SA_913 [Olavius algarvensis spirochete endosymbiont]
MEFGPVPKAWILLTRYRRTLSWKWINLTGPPPMIGLGGMSQS